MDKKRKDGYVTGLLCLIIFAIFLLITINTGWNTSGQMFLVFTILFGGLGFGSLWKPDPVGAVASQLLENLARSEEEGSSDSHDKQIQKKSSGIQVMAHDNAQVHINAPKGKEEKTQNLPEERENTQETFVVRPSKGSYYMHKLPRGDHFRGKVSSNVPINIYLVDSPNFDKWDAGKRRFDYEDCNEAILKGDIDYLIPRKGTWYVVIETEGRESATVEFRHIP